MSEADIKVVLEAAAPDDTNPKDLLGVKKVALSAMPPVALAQCCLGIMDGRRKYGPYNWRDKKVLASVYVDAALRHIQAWFDGEEEAEDSGVHHLGHAMACMSILLDAQAIGCLKDDRPRRSGQYLKLAKRVNELLTQHGGRLK